jgi:hypothetical protein
VEDGEKRKKALVSSGLTRALDGWQKRRYREGETKKRSKYLLSLALTATL